MEVKPGDYLFYSLADWERETYKDKSFAHSLHLEPQPDCPPEIMVYKGRYWVRPKYVFERDMSSFTPLYLGPRLPDSK